MPAVVGILAFYEQDKFRAQLSSAWKKFYNLGARLECVKKQKHLSPYIMDLFHVLLWTADIFHNLSFLKKYNIETLSGPLTKKSYKSLC